MKFLAVGLLACLASHAAIVIEDVTVIDVIAGAARPHCKVLIKGDRIASLDGPIPAGASIVNGRGKFLIPGLWDMHVHLWYKENQLPLFLAFGITGVQDMGSDFERVSAWRAAIESGKAIGPRVITSGPPVGEHESDDEKLPVLVAANPREARSAFDRLWDMDVDFIGVLPGLSRDSYLALAEQARHWHLRLSGSIPSAVTAWEALEARQSSIEHLAGVTKAVSGDAEAVHFFEECATRGVRLTPILVEWQRQAHANDPHLAGDAALRYVSSTIRKSWPVLKDDNAHEQTQIKDIYRLVSLATRTSVEVLAGSDTGEPWTIPGATLHDELEQLVVAGMTTEQALRTATIAPARFLETEDLMGTVEKGKLADLVLLDANPLTDIRNTRKIAGVFSRGKYFSRLRLNTIQNMH